MLKKSDATLPIRTTGGTAISQGTIKLKIFRYDPTSDKEPWYEIHEIPYWEKMRILDAINYVKDELARAGVAYRYSCGLRKCGTCGVLVNGCRS